MNIILNTIEQLLSNKYIYLTSINVIVLVVAQVFLLYALCELSVLAISMEDVTIVVYLILHKSTVKLCCKMSTSHLKNGNNAQQ